MFDTGFDYEIYEDEFEFFNLAECAELIPLPTEEDLMEAWWEG